MKRLIKRSFAATSLLSIAVAGLALIATPMSARADDSGCTIKCETCTCNLSTGVCDCKNCTLVGCNQT